MSTYPDAPGHRKVATSIAAADALAPKLGRLQRMAEGARAFLLLSKNSQEGKRRHGKLSGESESSYGLTGIKTLRRELRKLEDHAHALSLASFHMSDQRSVLSAMINTDP